MSKNFDGPKLPTSSDPELARQLRRGRNLVLAMYRQSLMRAPAEEVIEDLRIARGEEQSTVYLVVIDRGVDMLPYLIADFAKDSTDEDTDYVPIDLREEELAHLDDDPIEEAPYREILASALSGAGQITPAPFIQSVLPFLKDHRHRIRRDAARIIGFIGPAAIGAAEDLRAMLRDEDGLVRQAAARALSILYRNANHLAPAAARRQPV